MELKSENSFKEYLKKLSDDKIIEYYQDVEFTPFPILLIEEYTRRFKRKTKDEIIKDLKLQTRLARKKTKELGQMATKNKLVDDVAREKSKEIIKQAKKKGYKISKKISEKKTSLGSKLQKGKSGAKKTINSVKKLKTSNEEQLDLLEKLGQLNKAGIITNKEFQVKKKKILSKI